MNSGKEERKGIYFKREKRNRETDKAKKKEKLERIPPSGILMA